MRGFFNGSFPRIHTSVIYTSYSKIPVIKSILDSATFDSTKIIEYKF